MCRLTFCPEFIRKSTIVTLQEAGYTVVSVDNHSNSQSDVADKIASITQIKPRNYAIDICHLEELQQLFEQEGPFAGVIHMAAFKSVEESVLNPLKYYHNNLVGLLNVLKCCSKFNVKQIVFSSTCTVYGEPHYLPVDEAHPINPLSPYGKTKAIGEQMIQDFVSSHPLQAISLRFFNPVGAHPSSEIGEFPRGIPSNLLPHMAQTAAGRHPFLRVWGNDYPTLDGTCIRDYIHVCDLARVHVLALSHLIELKQKRSYEVFNIGTGRGVSVLEMHAAFEAQIQKGVPYKIMDRRAGDIESMFASNEKAKRELNWEPVFTLKDMVSSAWEWQQKLLALNLYQ